MGPTTRRGPTTNPTPLIHDLNVVCYPGSPPATCPHRQRYLSRRCRPQQPSGRHIRERWNPRPPSSKNFETLQDNTEKKASNKDLHFSHVGF